MAKSSMNTMSQKTEQETLVLKKLSSGTIALQAHDPESVIYYRSVKIKLLD